MSRLHDMFHIATNKKGYVYPGGVWRRSLRGSSASPSAAFWGLYAEACLMRMSGMFFDFFKRGKLVS